MNYPLSRTVIKMKVKIISATNCHELIKLFCEIPSTAGRFEFRAAPKHQTNISKFLLLTALDAIN